MKELDRIRRAFRDGHFELLPIPVYLIKRDGTFLEANESARAFFCLQDGEGTLEQYNIGTFYKNGEEREQLVRRLDESDKGQEKLEAQFHVQRKDWRIELTCRPVADQNGHKIAYLDCLLDVYEEDRFSRLFDHLFEGVFWLRLDGMVERVNKPIVEMFHCARSEDVEGKMAAEFFASKDDWETLTKGLRKRGYIRKYRARLKRGPHSFIAEINLFGRKSSTSGRVIGYEGHIIDVSAQGALNRLLEQLGLGWFEIRHDEDGVDRLFDCNQTFLEVFGYDHRDEVEGKDVEKVNLERDKRRVFLKQLDEHFERGEPLIRYPLTVQNHKGEEKVVEMNVIRLETGRFGVVQDITEEARLKTRIEHLRADVGNMLHSFKNALGLLGDASGSVSASLGLDDQTDIGVDIPTIEDILKTTQEPAQELARLLQGLVTLRDDDWYGQAFSNVEWNNLGTQLGMLRNYQDAHISPAPEIQLAVLVESVIHIQAICRQVRKRTIAKDKIRDIQLKAGDIIRRVAARQWLHIQTEVLALNAEVSTASDYLSHGGPRKVPVVIPLSELLTHALEYVEEYARRKGIDIKKSPRHGEAKIYVIERGMVRVFTNLLMNAIKYSWTRDNEQRSWISVNTRATVEPEEKRNVVVVSIENHGVPITKEELDQGLIFLFGYRGIMSGDRGRPGTGIGLTDARETIDEHKGTIQITSRSADRSEPDNYNKPFITTVTVTLPVAPDAL